MWWKIFLVVLGSLIILALLLVTTGNFFFNRQVKKEVKSILTRGKKIETSILTERDIENLPEPIQRYIRYTGFIGKEKVVTVKLCQKGHFRQGNRPWMPFEATQYYTTDPPAFIWSVKMKAWPLISVRGRDMYQEGKGNMLIKIPPFFTIADARGAEIDQGVLVRYLNEIMWFPSAYLADYIHWEPIDSSSARATMTYRGITASATLTVNNKGELVNFVAQRYFTLDDQYSLETWSTPLKEYREINGYKLPVKGEGIWHLSSGDFPYIRLEIVDIQYNLHKGN